MSKTKSNKASRIQNIHQKELDGISPTTENINELISGEINNLSDNIEDLMQKGQIGSIMEEIEQTTKKMQDMVWLVFIQQILISPDFLKALRKLGGTKALRFVSYQIIYITLPTGTKVQVISPFFVKAKPKRGPKKRGPQNRGSHLALELLGFVDKIAPGLAFRAIQLALLAPSFEIASSILKTNGVNITANKLRNLCGKLGDLSAPHRVELLMDENETCQNRRVLLSVDGGRLRQRKNKRGAIPKGNKLHGFNTDWIEPKMFVISFLDNKGNVIKTIKPFVDGVTGKLPAFLKLLKQYLTKLNIQEANEVILVADGAPWIWERIPALLKQLKVEDKKIFQIIDWTHAKQNLNKAFDLVSKKKKEKVKFDIREFKKFLFNGNIDHIAIKIKELFKVQKNSPIMKKIKSYFLSNKQRMQYQSARNKNIPIGSGCIESAIRRVINLRLKSAGSFWRLGFAETMIYLRAQLLYGRWTNLVKNLRKDLRQVFKNLIIAYSKNSCNLI